MTAALGGNGAGAGEHLGRPGKCSCVAAGPPVGCTTVALAQVTTPRLGEGASDRADVAALCLCGEGASERAVVLMLGWPAVGMSERAEVTALASRPGESASERAEVAALTRLGDRTSERADVATLPEAELRLLARWSGLCEALRDLRPFSPFLCWP